MVRVLRPGERVVTTEGRVSVVITPGRGVEDRRVPKVVGPRPYRGKGGDWLAERLAAGSRVAEG